MQHDQKNIALFTPFCRARAVPQVYPLCIGLLLKIQIELIALMFRPENRV